MVGIIGCFGSAAGAALSTVTVTASVSPQLASFSDAPVTFQQFDPNLGKLASVEIILQGTGQLTQQYENTGNRADSKQLRQTLDLTLAMPDASSPFLKADQVEKHDYAEGAFDGHIDFAGTSGETSVYDVTASNDKLLRSKSVLAMFTGSGLAELLFSAQAPFHSNSNKNSVIEARAVAGANITIIYNYISAPEPAWYGLIGGALALMAATLRGKPRNPKVAQN